MRKERKIFNKGNVFKSRYWVERNMSAKGYYPSEYTIIEVGDGKYTAALHGFIPNRDFLDKMGGFISTDEKEIVQCKKVNVFSE